MKYISFTVPCYNSATYMKKCVDSLLLYPDKVEIIIVNDGSTDDTGKIADDYAVKFPEAVRVVHQENGGHGEGINQGVSRACGKYFKVVDSDDWLDEEAVHNLIATIDEMESQGETVDMIVCNYVYEQNCGGKSKAVQYSNVFKSGKIISWDSARRFRLSQYLTLHACIFRTDILKECKMELPKHIFYEDNLYAYLPMPLVRRFIYLDIDLYRYLIGRDGQSVAEEMLIKRSLHQGEVSTRIFDAYNLRKIKAENKYLWRYMYHMDVFMLTIASAFLRMNGAEREETFRKNLWRHVRASDCGFRLKYLSLAAFSNFPGKLGCAIAIAGYRLAHRIIKFN